MARPSAGADIVEDMEEARYVTRLSRFGAFGVAVAITVAALLMGFAGHASADNSGWEAGVPLETAVPGNATQADIAVDSQGNAIAVWVQDYGNRSDILANRFVNGAGWGSPTAIETGDDAVNILPTVAIDAQGHGLVVWHHCPPPPPYYWVCTSIYAARFDPLTGWGLPTTLATSSVGQGSLSVRDPAVDGSGTAIVVWQNSIGDVWATRAALGGSWEAPTQIGSGTFPTLAVSPAGTAIAAWQGGAGYYPSKILANRFVPDRGWGSPVLVDPSNQANASWPGPNVAVNAAGIAYAVWNQESSSNTTRSDAWAARFVLGPGWGKATLLGKDSVFRPEVTVDSIGNAVATWTGYDWDSGHLDLMADRYVNGLGWGTATPVAPLMASDVGPGDFAMAGDSSGTALVVFADRGGRINATRWVPGLGWTSPSQIASGGSSEFGTGNGPAISSNPLGIAFAVWTGYDYPSQARSIWASRYVAPDVAPSPLELLVSSPAGSLTNNHDVTVSGTTQPGATVTVDGTQVSVDPAGAFSYTITLPEGPHTFVVVANGAAGGMNTKTITVVVDTRAPALTLVSPGDGVTTFDGTIVVSGRTEPGVTLVVDGLSAAVAPDGSFSIRLGLPEGRNTIAVTATDAAGNVAMASATVTYVKPPGQDLTPLVQDLALLRSVAIASSAGVLVLASIFLAFYWMRWRPRPDGPGGSQHSSRLEDPNGMSSEEGEVQRRTNDAGALLPPLGIQRRWPARPISGPVRLTAKERILLHLLHFARYAEASEVPRELTQERIVEAAGIDRRHFTQYVHPLVRDGLVRERMSHVRGAVQRRRVYVVTEEGRNRALGVRDRIRSAAVRVRDAAGVREVTVAEALLEARGSMSVLDILRESIETGVVDLSR